MINSEEQQQGKNKRNTTNNQATRQARTLNQAKIHFLSLIFSRMLRKRKEQGEREREESKNKHLQEASNRKQALLVGGGREISSMC